MYVVEGGWPPPRTLDNGGRGLQGVEETFNLTNLELGNYVKESREILLTAVTSLDIDLIGPIRETTVETKNHKKEENKEKDIAWSSCKTN